MKARILTTAAALGLSVALVAPSAEAQASASITATASVQVALSAVPGGNLDFGSVFPGTTRNVLTSDAAAGSFEITGADNAEITVTFPVLPTDLSDAAANLLPITFGATAASYNRSVDNRTAGTVAFDPSVGNTGNVTVISALSAPVISKLPAVARSRLWSEVVEALTMAVAVMVARVCARRLSDCKAW